MSSQNQKIISVIIPFYNEQIELPSIVKDINKFEKKKSNLILEYLFFNDCSNDKSLIVLKKYINKLPISIRSKIKIFKNKKNIGWSKTLIRAYKITKGKFTIFIPGDGEAKLTEFLKKINLKNDVIIYQRKSMPGRPLFRKIISRVYRYVIALIFFIKPMDFNGIIMMKTKKIKKLKISSESFFISAEIIVKCFKLNYSINSNNFFKLFPKTEYKSTSLSFWQFYKIIIDIIKTYKFFFIISYL